MASLIVLKWCPIFFANYVLDLWYIDLDWVSLCPVSKIVIVTFKIELRLQFVVRSFLKRSPKLMDAHDTTIYYRLLIFDCLFDSTK